VTCTIRRSRGEDIAAACGQLAGQVRKPQAAKEDKNASKPTGKRPHTPKGK
jgi:hypothetical protein